MPVNFDHRPPIVLRFLIACHLSDNPSHELGVRQWGSTAGTEVRQWLLDNDLVDRTYRTTERGASWLQLASNTPLPLPSRRFYSGYIE